MSNLKVLMKPHLDSFDKHESGIRRVIEQYFRLLPNYGIDLVNSDATSYDLLAVHAGMTGADADIAHLHGVYFTADYPASAWEYRANEHIVHALRNALEVTVPSNWVAETIQHDMRFNPTVVPHGIIPEEWEHSYRLQDYILWNKNRNADVCDPTPVINLARLRPNAQFKITFYPTNQTAPLKNVQAIGMQQHDVMRRIIKSAQVYLSTTKETFGIGILEALAAGVPVLGYKYGGNTMLVEHGINGYLARVGDVEDLARGLDYCIKHRDVLSANARVTAKKWDWPSAVEKVAQVYQRAYQKKLAISSSDYYSTAVVIPCYNYAHTLERAVKSALSQTHQPTEIIIVDDGSTDNTREVAERLQSEHAIVEYVYQENLGVAHARNTGISLSKSNFICCLDADDALEPRFLEACIDPFRTDRSLGITYTGIMTVHEDGRQELSQWPEEFNADKQLSPRGADNLRGQNQIPTCNVFKRQAWERTGGYRQRYAPLGAGAEDAEFWTRIVSLGYGAKKATNAGLFLYSLNSGGVSRAWNDGSVDKNLLEPQWLSMHPFSRDRRHPFASRATPVNGVSHPVRQYDEPVVSIVIPVGISHLQQVINAIDSVEAQSYRKWECIVVIDGVLIPDELETAYPFVKFYSTGYGRIGAGAARNLGAKHARAPFLVFLDADDSLHPDFLLKSLTYWREYKSIIYTDYVNKIIVSPEGLQDFPQQDVLSYIEKTQEAVIAGRSADYDCDRAQAQGDSGNRDLYHWCLVTCLVPKVWHDEIGGFDEKMQTFEDVLYHWSLARKGYCYTRLPEQLIVYRMYTGQRRELASLYTDEGRQNATKMLEYAWSQLQGIEKMACAKCPTPKRQTINLEQSMVSLMSNPTNQQQTGKEDDNYGMYDYTHPNRGNHKVVGAVTRRDYGYRQGGERFLVHHADAQALPQYFRLVQETTIEGVPDIVDIPAAPQPIQPIILDRPAEQPVTEHVTAQLIAEISDDDLLSHIAPVADTDPKRIIDEETDTVKDEIDPEPRTIASADEPIDLTKLPGITPVIADMLRADGVDTKAKVLALGVEGLQKYSGIGEVRAMGIITALEIDQRDAETVVEEV
jgi:glycosyltransferase involved in cell wall biosynthesis